MYIYVFIYFKATERRDIILHLFSGTVVTMVSCHHAHGFFLRRTDARPSMLHSGDPDKLELTSSNLWRIRVDVRRLHVLL